MTYGNLYSDIVENLRLLEKYYNQDPERVALMAAKTASESTEPEPELERWEQKLTRDKDPQWKQDTPRQQLVAIVMAIDGWSLMLDTADAATLEKAAESIKDQCDQLRKLVAWLPRRW